MNGAIPDIFGYALGCGFRVLGVFALLPLGWDLLGLAQRLALTAAAVCFLLPVAATGPVPGWDQLPLEFIAGMVLALPAALLIECASNAGELFDTLRGQTLATAYDPLQQETVAVSGTMAKFALWAFLLGSGAAVQIMAALADSFQLLPLGSMQSGSLPLVGRGALLYIARILTGSFAACLPFAAACIGCEFLLAVMVKQLPGLNLQTEAALAKLLIAVALVTATIESGALESLSDCARPALALLLPSP